MDIVEISKWMFKSGIFERKDTDAIVMRSLFRLLMDAYLVRDNPQSVTMRSKAQKGGRPLRFTKEEKMVIQRRYLRGEGIKTIARDMKASKNTVRKALEGVKKLGC